MKSIGIIGQGFVGTAVREGMVHAFDAVAYDKKEPNDIVVYSTGGPHRQYARLHPLKDVVDMTDGPIFICLPSPMKRDGSPDLSIIENVVRQLNEICAEKDTARVIIIKSTVYPGTTQRLDAASKFLHICFNPEFLREASYLDDFKNQKYVIIGGPREATNVVKQMYEASYPDVPVTKTSGTIAELVKYTINGFLSVKVSFANEMKLLCDSLDVDYDKVVEYATQDERLGTSHWAVPGPDGKAGFGGSCFPKDLNALMSIFRDKSVANQTMKGAWALNLIVRPDKDWEQLKGRAVVDEE